jgi:hypothetical protein
MRVVAVQAVSTEIIFPEWEVLAAAAKVRIIQVQPEPQQLPEQPVQVVVVVVVQPTEDLLRLAEPEVQVL